MFVESSFDELVSESTDIAPDLGMVTTRLSNGSVIHYRPGPNPISIMSGLHGDERSGPQYVVNLMKKWHSNDLVLPTRGLIVVPILNDQGWKLRQREWNGIDLNRQFNDETTIEHIRQVVSIYRLLKPTLHWDLHEDDQRTENYVFVHESDPAKAGDALAQYLKCPLQLWNKPDCSSEQFVHKEFPGALSFTTEANPLTFMNTRFEWLDKVYDFLVGKSSKIFERLQQRYGIEA